MIVMTHLECPICSEQYDIDEHQPKIIPCTGAHGICSACVDQLRAQSHSSARASSSSASSFACPQCREVISPDARVNPNRELFAVLQQGQTQRQQRSSGQSAKKKRKKKNVLAGDEVEQPASASNSGESSIQAFGNRWSLVMDLFLFFGCVVALVWWPSVQDFWLGKVAQVAAKDSQAAAKDSHSCEEGMATPDTDDGEQDSKRPFSSATPFANDKFRRIFPR